MDSRLFDRFRFILERWIQGGAWNQLLFVAGIIVLISFIGGLLAWALAGGFAGPLEAVWWSFLRLTDPGYLGDDEGFVLRTISTILTILGYVLFLGSLIAIMTQWLNQTMRRLESGLTPITVGGHILILGWTNRTANLIRELVDSQLILHDRRGRRASKPPRVVVLAENVGPELRHELREMLGPQYNRWTIILRSGSALRIEHLKRVDFEHAAAIVLPGADYAEGGHESSDARAMKALLTISRYLPVPEPGVEPPKVIAEILDSRKADVARESYPGIIEVISSDSFISRLMAQNVRHRGLSFIYSELLTHARGNELYVRCLPELAGVGFGQAQHRFPEAILLGITRTDDEGEHTLLNPEPELVLLADDRLIAIARTADGVAATDRSPDIPEKEFLGRLDAPVAPRRRILFLGWNHRLPSLLREFGGYTTEQFEIDVLSLVPQTQREDELRSVNLSGTVELRQLSGDYTDESVLAEIDPASYHNVVVLASNWLESSEETDARTILGYVVLRTYLDRSGGTTDVLVELMDSTNARLFRQRIGEVIVSPVVLSHLLAHISLRRELGDVFAQLFGPGGAEIFFRSCQEYGIAGETLRFRDIRVEATRRREIALGVHISPRKAGDAEGVYLNPPPDREWTFTNADRVIVLTTY